ncbi:hypothetical protein Glove_40g25 [Diversispora epigaea]|uniref:Serine-threonine/tyrosine-protein kinase catalytic domain-containing protein n=1 Tax=Diversispora epigaea TaxID=1348612 RepID=A0A397JGJ4_9GLOM|nr:hypothetical protein Glove_40g25 [Diversispora epigaea]
MENVIEFDVEIFRSVEYLTKVGFGKFHRAMRSNGYIKSWNHESKKKNQFKFRGGWEIVIYGITFNPKENGYMMVLQYKRYTTHEKIYGVIPFMAPETFREVYSSYPPYYNVPHDANLVIDICKELKPEIKCEIPQLLKDLTGKCWDSDPFNRPTAKELKIQLRKYSEEYDSNDTLKKKRN